MKARLSLLALALTVPALVAVAAQDPAPQDAPVLADLEFLAGHWRLEQGESMTEELWLPPRGGLMLGLNRSLQGERARGFEYLRIVQEKGAVVMYPSPGGGKPTPFRLTSAADGHAVFENPEHDFPKRIEYVLEGEVLTASIAGDEPGPSWSFKRIGKLK